MQQQCSSCMETELCGAPGRQGDAQQLSVFDISAVRTGTAHTAHLRVERWSQAHLHNVLYIVGEALNGSQYIWSACQLWCTADCTHHHRLRHGCNADKGAALVRLEQGGNEIWGCMRAEQVAKLLEA